MKQAKPLRRILLVRMDRIGDLILTLPVDRFASDAEASWWVTKGLGFIAQASRPPRQVRELPRRIQVSEFIRLLFATRRQKFDAAIIFHAPWWVSFLMWLARIPIRAGVKSQWHSYLFLNHAVRQKRSRAEVSELEYNFRIVERVFNLSEGTLKREPLRLGPANDDEIQNTLDRHGLKKEEYYVVHPGMGGSALNWPIEYYVALIQSLSSKAPVVITGTASDEPYLAPVRQALKETHGSLHPIIWLDQKLNGSDLISVLSAARAILAPSTGVLHIAASTGRPTFGIFSPVRVQHPRRWGPQGAQAKAFLPTVSNCPGELSCLGETCSQFDCMRTLLPETIFNEMTRVQS